VEIPVPVGSRIANEAERRAEMNSQEFCRKTESDLSAIQSHIGSIIHEMGGLPNVERQELQRYVRGLEDLTEELHGKILALQVDCPEACGTRAGIELEGVARLVG
jgi:hypothetical protein